MSPSECSGSSSTAVFQQFDREVVERFTDQPCCMPARVRAALENGIGGEPVRLYAFADTRPCDAPNWIALGDNSVAVAGEQPQPVARAGRETPTRPGVFCMVNSLGVPLFLVGSSSTPSGAMVSMGGSGLLTTQTRVRRSASPAGCERFELGWEPELEVRRFNRDAVGAVRVSRRGRRFVMTLFARDGETVLANLYFTRWQRQAMDSIRTALEQDIARRRTILAPSADDAYLSALAESVRDARGAFGRNWLAAVSRLIRIRRPDPFG